MGRIAVDIVLLPAPELMQEAVRLNRQLPREVPGQIVLNLSQCLPHISLAMGCLQEGSRDTLQSLLRDLASLFAPIRIDIRGIDETIDSGVSICALSIDIASDLQGLHEAVMDRTSPYLTHNATEENFAEAVIQPDAVHWVNRYPEAASFERFSPHITLGLGALRQETPLPAPSVASRLALCHLGNRCTCRSVLFETMLEGRSAAC